MSWVPNDPNEGESAINPDPRLEEKPHVVEPAFTIIDDRMPNKSDRSHSEGQTSGEGQAQVKSGMSLRFLCFLGLIFCSIFGLGMLLMSIVSSVIAAGYLFRNGNLNQAMGHFWKLSIHTLIGGIGCTIGLISPALGLALVALYFSLTGQSINNQFLDSVIKRSFNS